ncbi:hypothetical protein, partial [Pseudomonas aeruginosa]|uniref:hypothetical protein n=1 Tax=Pseudomonas aeruginosa TaxID=287 RepID=UPI0031B6D306
PGLTGDQVQTTPILHNVPSLRRCPNIFCSGGCNQNNRYTHIATLLDQITANRVITVNLLRGENLQILNVSRRKSPLLSLKKAKLFPDCTND